MYILNKNNLIFPHPHTADKSGIVAIGGDLSLERLKLAYPYGFFPWYNPGEPIIWWHPDPRFVIFTHEIRVTKSMRPYFNQERYKLTFDQEFLKVIEACQHIKRKGQPGTWISDEIIEAYYELHQEGFAHSVEVWDQDENLVGGLYGTCFGKIFFGESMFSVESNTSKFALISLAKLLQRKGFEIIDCQMPNDHLKKMGGRYLKREKFLEYLRQNIFEETLTHDWNTIINDVPVHKILSIQ